MATSDYSFLWSFHNIASIFVVLTIYVWIKFIKICPTCSIMNQTDVNGKTALITEGGKGIGKAVAIKLARRKGRVIIACSNPEEGLEAVKDIQERSGNKLIQYMHLDLSDLKSVREFAKEFMGVEESLDILVHNARVSRTGRTKQGFDVMFATNHLGPFLLTNLLLPLLKTKANFFSPARIVNICSDSYKTSDVKVDLDCLNPNILPDTPELTTVKQYARTKLMSFLFTMELNRRFAYDCVYSFSSEPGCVNTHTGMELYNQHGWLSATIRIILLNILGRSPFFACETTFYCCIEHFLTPRSDTYYATRFGPGEIRPCKLHPDAMDSDMARKLWIKCEELCQLKGTSDGRRAAK